MIFWVVTPCGLAGSYHRFGEQISSIFMVSCRPRLPPIFILFCLVLPFAFLDPLFRFTSPDFFTSILFLLLLLPLAVSSYFFKLVVLVAFFEMSAFSLYLYIFLPLLVLHYFMHSLRDPYIVPLRASFVNFCSPLFLPVTG